MGYVDLYSEVKKRRPSTVREAVRDVVLSGLALRDRWIGMEDQLKRPRVQFIYIHHVFPDEEAQLRRLLETLQKHHTFISYSDAVDKILNGEIDKPYVAISSDDGFKNNLRAAEILTDYGAKSCFFINPSIIEETDYQKIATYCHSKLDFPTVEFLNWREVEKLQALGHEIGSHTMSHINIAQTPLAAITEDMQQSYAVLNQRCGTVKHFAFPFGRFIHFNEEGRKACFDAGFLSCATAERGCHINPEKKLLNDKLCILRDHVILDWNIDHVLYFLTKNARHANVDNNFFPYKTN